MITHVYRCILRTVYAMNASFGRTDDFPPRMIWMQNLVPPPARKWWISVHNSLCNWPSHWRTDFLNKTYETWTDDGQNWAKSVGMVERLQLMYVDVVFNVTGAGVCQSIVFISYCEQTTSIWAFRICCKGIFHKLMTLQLPSAVRFHGSTNFNWRRTSSQGYFIGRIFLSL